MVYAVTNSKIAIYTVLIH